MQNSFLWHWTSPGPAVARPEETRAGSGGPAGSTGGLWGAMEPCFHGLGLRTEVPVTLDIAIDAGGRFSLAAALTESGMLRALDASSGSLTPFLARGSTGGAGAGSRPIPVEVAARMREAITEAGEREVHVVHLGDVYYAGTRSEARTRFL